MTPRALFFGLTPISLSISLALKCSAEGFESWGYDPQSQKARQAEKAGQLSRAVRRPDKVLSHAELVFLAIPSQDLEPYLEMLAQKSVAGTVIFDLTPSKGYARALAQKILPPECHFVGLLPALNPATLQQDGLPHSEPSPHLFNKGLLGIIPAPSTPSEVMDLSLRLCEMLGAAPFFLQAEEADSAQAAIEGLPALISDALLHATMASPTWHEVQRLAGHTWLAAVSLGTQTPEALADLIDRNRPHFKARLQQVQDQLARWMQFLERGSRREIAQHLEESAGALQAWLADRALGDWAQAGRPSQPLPRRGLFGTLRRPKADE
jgi:prephenate dehydrogenase